jgi:hypothetical protein
MAIKFLRDQDCSDYLPDAVLRRMLKSAPQPETTPQERLISARSGETEPDDLEALLEWGRKQAQTR